MGEQGKDRRVYERFRVNLPVKFIEIFTNLEGKGRTIDISAGGIGLFTEEDIKPERHIELWIDVPDKGEPLYAKGKIVWVQMLSPNNFAVGIELEKTDFIGVSRVLWIIHNKNNKS